ncbi:MAG: hypothetical protein JXA10_08510 [Anaerolineae bacterium]|nr:hypothetical protein [Anaerolineae bacterium]
MSPRLRLIIMLVLDGIALIGLVVFSVSAALHRDNSFYLAGQIVCAIWVLWTALMLHRSNRHEAENQNAKKLHAEEEIDE